MKNINLILIAIVLIVIVSIVGYVLFTSGTITPRISEIIVKNSGGSTLLIAECSNKSYLYDKADVIVIGNVSKVETKQEQGQIYTYSSISVENFGKGSLNSNVLTIKTPGGCIGTNCVVIEDQPILHKNKLVRIYLKQTGNEFSILCGTAGVEEVGRI